MTDWINQSKSAPSIPDSFLLKEDGDFLLQENGDQIVLDYGSDGTPWTNLLKS